MANRPIPLNDQVDLLSSDDDDGRMEVDGGPSAQHLSIEAGICYLPIVNSAEDTAVVRRAKMYQEYMKKVPIPTQRGSTIPCNSWVGLAKSMKELYGQPLHYLTNTLLKQWDQARFETGDDYQPLDTVIHPLKAESTVWFIEEVHRCTASHLQLSKLWAQDTMYHAFIDPVFPKI